MGAAVLSVVIYSLLFVLICYSGFAEKTDNTEKIKVQKNYKPFYIAIALIALLQLILTQFSKGYIQDTGLFRYWTSWGEKYHIWEYYTAGGYVDYPPVYLTVLFIVGKIASLFGVSSSSNLYLCFIRFVPILFDALTSVFIFRFGRDKIGEKNAMLLAFLSIINPFNIMNSTVWGQVDSVVTMMLIALLFFLYNKKYVAATCMFVLCFMTKPQMIIYAPLFGFTIFFDFIEIVKDKEERTKMLKQIGLAVICGIAVLLITPLAVTGGNYMLLVEKYKSALAMYQYATVCAANFFGAIGANWVKNTDPFLFLTYKTWGFIFIVTMSLIVGFVSYKVKDRSKIFYMGAFTVSSIYMFAHGMHERYIYSLFLILLIIYMLKKDKKILTVYLLFSMSAFINCTQTLIVNHANTFIYADNTMFILNSWANLVTYAFMVYVFFTHLFKEKKEVQPVATKKAAPSKPVKKTGTLLDRLSKQNKKSAFEFQKPYEPARFKARDYIIMAVITLAYSVLAFYNLGSREVPENGWYPASANESVVIDLGKECDIQKIYTFSGWIDRHKQTSGIERTFKIETSTDGLNYSPARTTLKLDKVFGWKATDFTQKTRYIKLTPDDDRFYLNEIAFFGATEQDKFVPVSATGDSVTAYALIDEQDKVRYEFSWYDGTYFDEIYHPRTAYENITHRYPYENTHPPLGKLIIACGMLIFGVNPFGWRFFGTLCGVLMVPLCYIMGKKMFKKTSWATLVCLVFSFDFMHLSQTRLATIDSYTTFFVMAMYFFMYLYISRSFYNEGFKKTVPPLLASGICFGLGAATKWQGIYAGLGLCVLFFVTLYRRYAEYEEALKIVRLKKYNNKEENARMKQIVDSFAPCATKTVLCGFLFFVVVPFIIYFLSYIPAMNTPYTGLSFFFTNQSSMYNYHAGIEANHPYMSSWWSWPLDYKPLYAYGPNRSFVPQGYTMAISSFGNPFVWWLTIPVVLGAVYLMFKKKGDLELKTMLAGFGAMYLPWVLVSRSSFIYHFFPCVIFVVLMIVYFARKLYEKNKYTSIIIVAYAVAVVYLFLRFYPVLTGMEISLEYQQTLKWLSSWVLG